MEEEPMSLVGAQSDQFWEYPATPRDPSFTVGISEDVKETLGIEEMEDEYQWLEDSANAKVHEWIESQNKLTFGLLESIRYRNALKENLSCVWNYKRYGCILRHGTRYFFMKNDGLQPQSVLYVQEALSAPPRKLLDPNELSDEGTTSLYSHAISKCGEYLAYGLSHKGSDWITVYVKKISSGEMLPDKVKWIKFSSIAWAPNAQGFFYARYPRPRSLSSSKIAGTEVDSNAYHKLYFHKLGTHQKEDILIHELPERPHAMLSKLQVSPDGRYLLFAALDEIGTFYYADLLAHGDKSYESLKVVEIIEEFRGQCHFVTNVGSVFYFQRNDDLVKSPRGQIRYVDINNPSKQTELISQKENVLEDAICVAGDMLVLQYVRHVTSILLVYSLQHGTFIKDIPLPPLSSVINMTGEPSHNEMFFQVTSHLLPAVTFRYNFAASDGEEESSSLSASVGNDGANDETMGERTEAGEVRKRNENARTRAQRSSFVPLAIMHRNEVPGFNPGEYVNHQVFYKSKDGTTIPMFILRKKSIPLDGSAPVYLYGYGGFNLSVPPEFNPSRVVLMKNLGVNVAIANIRGGNEYGIQWWVEGRTSLKQNVFDDFQAAAEYLIKHKYTSPKRLVISGASNGGVTVGACMNQRPDLYGCVIAQVGLFDMLRFHKFTIGQTYTLEYGDPSKPEDFEHIVKYSPLHNVAEETEYPAVLLTTGDYDDRAPPLHSYKFISVLQRKVGLNKKQAQPLLLRVSKRSGHAGTPTLKAIEEVADIYAFIGHVLGLSFVP